MWDKLREQLKQMAIEKELEEELRSGIALEARRAEADQKKLAKFNRDHPRRGIDGLGQVTMSMDPFWRGLADVRFGRDWAKDKAARRRLLAEHPEFAVPYARKAMVTVLKPGESGGRAAGNSAPSPAPLILAAA